MSRRLAPAVLIVVMIAVLIGGAFVPWPIGALGTADFFPYWCAAYLLVHGHNPYDTVALSGVYQMVAPETYATIDPIYRPPWALGPPWAVLLVAPFGLLPFGGAVRLWLMMSVIVMCSLSLFLWRWLRGPATPDGQLLALLVGLGFAQVLAALALGQIVIFVLLGLVLSLALLETGHDGWAGAAFLLVFIKPQAAYLLGPALLVWTLGQRRWRMWLSLFVTTVVVTALAALIAPGTVEGYIELARTYDFFRHSAATLGGVTQAYFNTNFFRWIGLATWLLVPWLVSLMNRRGVFTGANTALLISMPLAPYGWGYDQILLIPAIMQIAIWALETKGRQRVWLLGALAAIYLGLLLVRLQGTGDFLYVWVPVAIGAVYATAVRLLNPVNGKMAQAAVS